MHTPPNDSETKAVETMGSKLLNQPITVTSGELLRVSPEIREFLLHHTSKRVDLLSSALGSTSTTTPTKRIFKQEDVSIDAMAVDCNLHILSVQIGMGTLDDVLLDGGLGVNIITKDVRVQLGLRTPKPPPYWL